MFRDALAEHLEEEEGKRHEPYTDTLGNITIGIGRALEKNPLDDEEVYFLLLKDIKRAEKVLDRMLPEWREFSLSRQIALASMAFQLGGHGLSRFMKMLRAIRDNDWNKAADEALESRWAKQTPKRAVRIAEMLRDV